MFIIAVFTAGGYLLDRLLETLPLFLLLGMLVGFVASLYYLYSALKRVGGG
jgi:F0F1-type ATP synthase assembly protein I